MAGTLVAKGTVSFNAASTALTPSYPAGLQANDIAVLVHCSDTSSAITWPGDYTTFTKQVQTTVWGSQIAWKRLTGSESGTISLPQGTAVVKMAQFFIFRGCITTGDPFEGYNPINVATNPLVSGTITTLGPDRLAVNLVTVSDDVIGSTPAGWTTPFAADTTTTGSDIGLCCDIKAAPTAGVVATASRTLAGNNPATVHSFALIPEPPAEAAAGDTTVTIDAGGAGSWTVPAGVTSIDVECWGAGGGGYGGGGSGGAYARTINLTVVPGGTVYYLNGTAVASFNPIPPIADTWVNISANSAPGSKAVGALAKPGQQPEVSGFTGQPGGLASASIGDTKFSGGTGGNTDGSTRGGGGGGAAGDANAGGNHVGNYTGGAGGTAGGGKGGDGDNNGSGLQAGTAPGGGGGGNWLAADANGANGRIKIWYTAADGSANVTTGSQTTSATTQSAAATVGVAVTRPAQPTNAATQSSTTKVLAAVTGAQTLSATTQAATAAVVLPGLTVTGAQATQAAGSSATAAVGIAVTASQTLSPATTSAAVKVLVAVTGAQATSAATTLATAGALATVTGAQTTLATTQTGTIVLSIAGQATVSGAQTTSAAITAGTIGLGDVPVEPPIEVPSGGGGSRAYRRRLREAREGRRVFEDERQKRIAAIGIERPPLIPAPETVTMIARVLYEPIVRPIEVEPTQPEFEDDGEEEELLLLMLAS